ncbi:LOW QUALITY PROTEIN: hypothetical protein PanWU01x14_090620, partial [Parasponia andersonii]
TLSFYLGKENLYIFLTKKKELVPILWSVLFFRLLRPFTTGRAREAPLSPISPNQLTSFVNKCRFSQVNGTSESSSFVLTLTVLVIRVTISHYPSTSLKVSNPFAALASILVRVHCVKTGSRWKHNSPES